MAIGSAMVLNGTGAGNGLLCFFNELADERWRRPTSNAKIDEDVRHAASSLCSAPGLVFALAAASTDVCVVRWAKYIR